MRFPVGQSRRLLLLLLAAVVVAWGCSSDDGAPVATEGEGAVVAQVASYEPVAGPEQRFIVALVTSGDGGLVGFGEADMSFRYLGTEDDPVDGDEPFDDTVRARFLLVAGQDVPSDGAGPRRIRPSEGLGVYGADVTFDRPGFWEVRMTVDLPQGRTNADATFEVLAEPLSPFPGEPAPRTENRLIGDPSVPSSAIDSRAGGDGDVPDAELHESTVAAAIAAQRPVMVVVSTPTYCVSRFCGPITDSVQRLAQQYGDRMAFVHAEVWNDYEARSLNREAAEWIYRTPETDAREPWVFLVGPDGNVASRWDNVVTDEELEQAVTSMLASR